MARGIDVRVERGAEVHVAPAAGPVGSGIVAGIAGGLAMAMVAMLYFGWLQQGATTPLRLIAVVAYGLQSLVMPYGPLVAGSMIHLAVSIAFGLGFSFAAKPSTTPPSALLAGLTYGVSIWAVMTFFVLPWLNPALAERVALLHGPWFLAHVAFGAGVSIAPWLRRRPIRIGR